MAVTDTACSAPSAGDLDGGVAPDSDKAKDLADATAASPSEGLPTHRPRDAAAAADFLAKPPQLHIAADAGSAAAAQRPDVVAGSGGGGEDGSKREMRDLEELLSKLNPMTEEFVPPSIAGNNQAVSSGGGVIAVDGGFYANGFGVGQGVVNGSANVGGGRRKKNGFGQGNRRMNNRTTLAQREEVIRRTVYVADIDHQITVERSQLLVKKNFLLTMAPKRQRDSNSMGTALRKLAAVQRQSSISSRSQSNTENQGSDETSQVTRGRGTARGPSEWGTGQRLHIDFNSHWQPIGPNKEKLTSQLGIIARNNAMCPLTCATWHDMTEELLDHIWKEVKDNTDVPDEYKLHCLKSVGVLWRDWKARVKKNYYKPYQTNEERNSSHPFLLKLILGFCWYLLHLLVNVIHMLMSLKKLLLSYIISTGLLRKYQNLQFDKLNCLAVVVDSEQARDTTKIKQLLCWLAAFDIKYIALYDMQGELKKAIGNDLKSLTNMTPCSVDDVETRISLFQLEKMTIEVLSQSDGKKGIAKAASFLYSKYMKDDSVSCSRSEPALTESDVASALEAIGYGGPEPELLLVYGPARCHLGFPAWRLRYTEIVHMGSLRSMNYGAFLKAMYDFSKKHQNYGK